MFSKTALFAACSAAVVAAGLPMMAQAQSSATLEEIVVTAEKRSANLQDTASAIAAVSGDQLAAQGISDQSQLAKAVPGLVMASQGGTGLFFIRGIGQTQGSPNTQPAVSVNLNGVYWSREMGITPLFDMERVEVLPGPQGTLWGRNAAGGAINFVTKRPMQDFGGDIALELGDYDLVHVTGVVNIPLTDKFAVRVAADSLTHSGYLSNGAFDADDRAVRLSALYEDGPLSIFGLYMRVENGGIGNNSVLYNAAGLPGLYNPTPGNPYNQTFNTSALYQDSVTDAFQLEVDYQLGSDLTLTYLPGYVKFDGDKNQMFSGTTPTRIAPAVDQQTHEVRLANGPDGKWRWVVGAYGHRATHDFRVTTGTHLPAPTGVSIFQNKLRSAAVFGEATYSVTDDFRVTFGGRYSSDRFAGSFFGTSPPGSAARPVIGRGSRTTDNTDFKIGAELDLRDEETMLYATIQTGYLMGGYVQDGSIFNPVNLVAYTAGAKNRFFNNRVQLNAEAYYYDYQDYQLTYVQGTFFAAQNAPARVIGAQVDFSAVVTDNDTVGISATAQDARILDRRLFPRNGVPSSIYDFELPNAPELTVTASWEHVFNLPGGANLTARAQTYYNSGYWMVFTKDTNTYQGSYTNSDASLTYNEPEGRWSVGAWVRNIEDEAVFIGANKPQPNASTAPYLMAPRTYGVAIRASF